MKRQYDTVYVYAYLDTEGRYLYIGQSGDPQARERMHRHASPWLPHAAERVILSEHQTRGEALRAEREAIREHRPKFNVACNPDPSLGPKIRAMRTEQGLTLAVLAGRVGCSIATLSLIENGHRSGKFLAGRIYAALGHKEAAA